MIEMTKKIPAIVLVILFAVQLYVPISMILGQETVIEKGTLYKFRVGLLDPVDPFRGRYVVLNIQPSTVKVLDEDCSKYKDMQVSVKLTTDTAGYTLFDGLRTQKNVDQESHYINMSVRYAITPFRPLENSINDSVVSSPGLLRSDGLNDSCTVHLDIPFSRYYMEETKAPKAERFMWSRELRENTEIWLEVRVLDGKAATTGLFVDGVPIEDMVKEFESEGFN